MTEKLKNRYVFRSFAAIAYQRFAIVKIQSSRPFKRANYLIIRRLALFLWPPLRCFWVSYQKSFRLFSPRTAEKVQKPGKGRGKPRFSSNNTLGRVHGADGSRRETGRRWHLILNHCLRKRPRRIKGREMTFVLIQTKVRTPSTPKKNLPASPERGTKKAANLSAAASTLTKQD